LQADGAPFATIETDNDGDGYLHMRTWGDGAAEVLKQLPPAEDIVSVTVTDQSAALVLMGTCSVVRQPGEDDLVYEEKIVLDGLCDDAVGMAGVRVTRSGAQQFVTRASNLTPGDLYRIIVDGTEVGVVTVDEIGQGVLELESPSEHDPLPAELQPVSGIRAVGWYLGDDLCLTGTFTGNPDDRDTGEEEGGEEPECAELEGTVLAVGDGELLVQVGGDELVLLITEETVVKEMPPDGWFGAGDVVRFEACSSGEGFIAYWIILVEDADEPEWCEVNGNVSELYTDGFTLETEDGILRVFVNGDTDYVEVGGLDDLLGGDFVFAGGPCDGDNLEAVLVKLVGRPK
jgi:hypothetical protein